MAHKPLAFLARRQTSYTATTIYARLLSQLIYYPRAATTAGTSLVLRIRELDGK